MAVTVRPVEHQEPVIVQPGEPRPQGPRYEIPIEVDFSVLQPKIPDLRGWIYCPDTPIHYPVVQGKDNRYYVRRMPTGEANHSGSIFLDRRNPSDLSGRYNLIHGHNMQDTSMFGTLPNYKDQAYYDEHKLVYLLTPDGDYVIELFAGFTAPHDDSIYTIPATGKERMRIAQECIGRSDFTSEVRPQEDDQLIILSTCDYTFDEARYVVIGILRKN